MAMRIILPILFFLFCIHPILYSVRLEAQTCCSAGAPISSSLSISPGSPGSFAFQLGYEYKGINLLIDNNEELVNDPRTRFGQNLTAKVDYIANDRWAFTLLLPFVHQSRTTISESQSSFGPGDLTAFGQYTVTTKKQQFIRIGAGIKMPTGRVDHRGPSGVFLSPDMQSGSGSWAIIGAISFEQPNTVVPNLTWSSSANFTYNGTNSAFAQVNGQGGRLFQFGHELMFSSRLSYLVFTPKWFIQPDAGVRFRYSTANIEQESEAPNSGGSWFSLPVGVQLVPNGRTSFRLYAELPIYQQLNGLQITTSFTAGLQWNYFLPNN